MKIIRSKPRQIRVNGENYIYIKSIDNDLMSESTILLKLFLENHKKTPLIFYFTASNEPDIGHQLYAGVVLENKITQSKQRININEPKWVHQFILEGLKIGWTGKNILEYQDGNQVIENWGFDIFDKIKEWLYPNYKSSKFTP
jgi:hypothetical protein